MFDSVQMVEGHGASVAGTVVSFNGITLQSFLMISERRRMTQICCKCPLILLKVDGSRKPKPFYGPVYLILLAVDGVRKQAHRRV